MGGGKGTYSGGVSDILVDVTGGGGGRTEEGSAVRKERGGMLR